MKAFITVSRDVSEIDTIILTGESVADMIYKAEKALTERYSARLEFAYTIYHAPRGLQVPTYSRRGLISDIIADIARA